MAAGDHHSLGHMALRGLYPLGALLLPRKENVPWSAVWLGDYVEGRGMSVNGRKAGQRVGRGETGPGDGGGQRGCCGYQEAPPCPSKEQG